MHNPKYNVFFLKNIDSSSFAIVAQDFSDFVLAIILAIQQKDIFIRSRFVFGQGFVDTFEYF